MMGSCVTEKAQGGAERRGKRGAEQAQAMGERGRGGVCEHHRRRPRNDGRREIRACHLRGKVLQVDWFGTAGFSGPGVRQRPNKCRYSLSLRAYDTLRARQRERSAAPERVGAESAAARGARLVSALEGEHTSREAGQAASARSGAGRRRRRVYTRRPHRESEPLERDGRSALCRARMLCSTTKSVGKQRVPHARRALPLLLTGALLQLLPAASQSQDCPVTPSTVPLSCLSGYTVSGGPSAVCDCQCGVNASAATDNAGGGQKLILQARPHRTASRRARICGPPASRRVESATICVVPKRLASAAPPFSCACARACPLSQVASGAACSPTACRSCFTPCSAAAFVNATYASMAALQLDGQLSSVSYGTGAICITRACRLPAASMRCSNRSNGPGLDRFGDLTGRRRRAWPMTNARAPTSPCDRRGLRLHDLERVCGAVSAVLERHDGGGVHGHQRHYGRCGRAERHAAVQHAGGHVEQHRRRLCRRVQHVELQRGPCASGCREQRGRCVPHGSARARHWGCCRRCTCAGAGDMKSRRARRAVAVRSNTSRTGQTGVM